MTAGAIIVPTIMPLRAPIPGQHKSCIDTNTKIEMHSDTIGVTIYYTINGNKPEPFQKHGPAAKSTLEYREPYRLPAGKKVVKAVAISEDGMRESHVVSKAFDVEQIGNGDVPLHDNGLNFINDIPHNEVARKEVNKFAHKMVSSKQAWDELQRMKSTEDMMKDMSMGSGRRSKGMNTGPRFLNNRMATQQEAMMMNGTMENEVMLRAKRTPPDTSTQAMRLQRETDFLKCVYCFSPRPSDPYARFCHDCGNPVPPLPQTRMAPPEAGQMGTCVHCKSLVPFNTPTCVICEAPIPPQNQPQASVRLANKLLCTLCGSANPANLASCVVCEAKLPAQSKPIYHGHSAPPMPKDENFMLTCTKCARVNSGDARFCDWCGTKPSPPSSNLVCSKCHANNHPYAKFCGACGVLVEPPQRPSVRNSGMSVNMSTQNTMNGPAQWMPVSLPFSPVPKCEIATQTVGLFYPSQREINKKNTEEEEKLAIEKMSRDRKPLMTAVSPGKGYWRKQMDHVTSHLKTYAQNNAEFRSLIGEPRMGKIISAAIHEDGYDLSLTMNFALRGTKDPLAGKRMGHDFLSSYTHGRKDSLSSYASQDSLAPSTARSTSRRTKRKGVKTKRRPKTADEPKLTAEDKQLLKEVGKSGEGTASEIEQLLEEGADANCVNKDGIPVLHIATMNKHIDAIPVLVQNGADVNKKGPQRGNTALHVAVSLGNSGEEVIDTLLGVGANPQKKNDKGETPYDLAVKDAHDVIANKLSASLGQTALDKLIKPRASQSAHDF